MITSYDELEAYAKSKGGRIPTETELRLYMDHELSRGRVDVHNSAGWGFQRWWLEPYVPLRLLPALYLSTILDPL